MSLCGAAERFRSQLCITALYLMDSRISFYLNQREQFVAARYISIGKVTDLLPTRARQNCPDHLNRNSHISCTHVIDKFGRVSFSSEQHRWMGYGPSPKVPLDSSVSQQSACEQACVLSVSCLSACMPCVSACARV